MSKPAVPFQRSSNDELERSRDDTLNEKSERNTKDDSESPIQSVPLSAEQEVDEFPDGGLQAWMIVCGAVLSTFSTFGYVNAWGAFQAYYQEDLLKDYTASQISWIGSLQYSLVFLPSLPFGRLFDLGYFKVPYFCASVLIVVSTFIVAQCTKYWQFVLCQGVLIGFGSGVLFSPCLGVVSHWFKKRIGLALGLTAVGSSIGGTVFPILTRNLIKTVGFPWTMRIVGFVLIVTLGAANFTLKRRLPPKSHAGGLFNLRAFKSIPYTIYCVSTFVMFLGIYTVLTYIDVSATSVGVSPDFSFYLISIANAASGFGRYFGGLSSDRIGPMNTMIPMTLAAGIMTYAWPYARNQASLIVIAILYGFCSGTYVALVAAPVMAMGETHDVGRRTGMTMTILCLGAVIGPPISGAIATKSGGYEMVGIYAGTVVVVGVTLMIIVRWFLLKKHWGKI